MLRHPFATPQAAEAVETSVHDVLDAARPTPGVAGSGSAAHVVGTGIATTSYVGRPVVDRVGQVRITEPAAA